jgi:hypothetical protein
MASAAFLIIGYMVRRSYYCHPWTNTDVVAYYDASIAFNKQALVDEYVSPDC